MNGTDHDRDEPEHTPAEAATTNTARTRRLDSDEFSAMMRRGWGPDEKYPTSQADVAPYALVRRDRLAEQFPASRLVIPAGSLVTRSNDTDYRFRPHSAFSHLTGLGTDQEPDAVLVVDTCETRASDRDTLYVRPPSGKDSDEFFASARYGEFWVGPRPSLDDLAIQTGITTRDIAHLSDDLAKDLGGEVAALLVVADADRQVTALVEQIRSDAGLTVDPQHPHDDELARAVSELRLIKDDWEVSQIRQAIEATALGFENIVRAIPRAVTHRRGERVIEGAFDGQARIEGNAVGYETIAASGDHATILHWIRNDGPVRDGDLLLVDAGVEVDSLYTADITRTMPVSGTFSTVQRRVYQAVLDAADAAFEAARPGNRFRDVHDAAMAVIAQRLEEWGLLPVSASQALSPDGQQHRRWMVHGTSHHLGIDVHDCAQARQELYLDAVLQPGMVFTIEPGLYFKSNDLLVPPEYRGIGVRIEDDVLITPDGNVNLSSQLPRDPDAVEQWMASLRA